MSRILHITDTHIAPPPLRVGGLLNTAALFEQAIDKIHHDLPRLGKIDLILVTGDISEFGDKQSYLIFQSTIAKLNLPYLVIPGNHDCRDTMRIVLSEQPFATEISTANAAMNWYHPLDDLDIIGLDSCLPTGGKGALSEETLHFLHQTLATETNKPALIALHHPPFTSGVGFMDAIGLNNAPALADILSATQRPIRVICGHLHNRMIGEVGGKVAITAPATISSFKTDYRDDAPVGFTTQLGGYMLHDWQTDSFRSTYIPLDEVSEVHPF